MKQRLSDLNKLQLQQYLGQHPILKGSMRDRIVYVSAIKYLCDLYPRKDQWTISMLSLMKEQLMDNNNYVDLKLDSQHFVPMNRKPGYRQKYKFLKYRYSVLTDCLFLCAYDTPEEGKFFLSRVCRLFPQNKKKLTLLYENFYQPDMAVIRQVFPGMENTYGILANNRAFLKKPEKRIMITANMSAGKSTLLNALVGKKVNKMQNDTCTAKIHYLYNKAGEDGFSYELDHALELNASLHTLMEDNQNNEQLQIYVGTRFRSLQEPGARVCFIDTPGVNSSQNADHRAITDRAIADEKVDWLIYLLNGENIGTDDDIRHLTGVAEAYHGKVIFLVNKLDSFKKDTDSVADTLRKVRGDLTKAGFTDPRVYPLSAYGGYLAKMELFGEELTDDERDDMEFRMRKLSRKEFRYDTYYEVPSPEIDETNAAECLLRHSGILALEKMLYS